MKVTVVLKMSGATKWMERCLWAIGFLVLAAWFGVWFNARQQQAEGNRELERRLDTRRGVRGSSSPGSSSSRGSPTRARLPEGALVGRIEIPRIGVSTIVFEGTGDNVLSIGVGHLSGTSLPGEQGNVVLAAHRDTFFRPLRSVQKYDRIVMVTPAGKRLYQVESTAIVSPNYLEVLAPTPGETLTLVTCYPFEWFGHAPKRFIVRAHGIEDPTHSGARTSAMKEKTRSEEFDTMAGVNRPPPIRLPIPVKQASMRTIALSQSEPVEGKSGPAPHASGIEPPPLLESTPSVKKTTGVQASTAVQETAIHETTEPALEADAPPTPKGNRIMRGLKKLNPKRLVSKMRDGN